MSSKLSNRLNARRCLIVLGVAFAFIHTAFAQNASSDEDGAPYTAAELEELVGPIALYPDDLIGIILPASTYPLQIVQAARFLEEAEDDGMLEPDEAWDESVVALLNYPEVIELMNDDLDWTWALGEAVLHEQGAVFNAIQRFRGRARVAGNLRSDERQLVTEEEGVVKIAPADPKVIYVPYYEPERVVVYQRRPVYHYYPRPYPVYYYPYPVGYSFGSGFFWGVTTAFVVGWHSHYLHAHHHSYVHHPYYGHHYYTPYYSRRSISFNVNFKHGHHVWQPRHRYGARPYSRVTRSYEGRARSTGYVGTGLQRNVRPSARSTQTPIDTTRAQLNRSHPTGQLNRSHQTRQLNRSHQTRPLIRSNQAEVGRNRSLSRPRQGTVIRGIQRTRPSSRSAAPNTGVQPRYRGNVRTDVAGRTRSTIRSTGSARQPAGARQRMIGGIARQPSRVSPRQAPNVRRGTVNRVRAQSNRRVSSGGSRMQSGRIASGTRTPRAARSARSTQARAPRMSSGRSARR